MENNFHLLFDIGDATADIMIGLSSGSQSVGYYHYHHHMECHMVYRGSMEIEFDDGCHLLQAGDICIIPKQVYHKTASASADLQRCAFMLTLRYNKKSPHIFKKWTLLFSHPEYRIIKSNLLQQSFEEIQEYLLQSSNEATLKLHALFSLILLELSDKLQRKGKNNQANASENDNVDDRLYEIENFLELHYMKDLSLHTLAKYMHLCERQLNRILIKNTTLSFRDLLLRQRMWVAKDLLMNPDIKIVDIPAMVGFHSYSGFYYSVKKFWGASPDDIRNNNILL